MLASVYYIISNVQAENPTVRVLDIYSAKGEQYDMEVSNLIGCIKEGQLTIENAIVENDELKMIDGDLEQYGKIVHTAKGPEVDVVAVAIGEIVDDDNDKIVVGYRFASSDGTVYNWSIEESQNLLSSFPIANAKAYKDEQGIYWLKEGSKPLPKVKASWVVNASKPTETKEEVKAAATETAVEDKEVKQEVQGASKVEEPVKVAETKETVVEPNNQVEDTEDKQVAIVDVSNTSTSTSAEQKAQEELKNSSSVAEQQESVREEQDVADETIVGETSKVDLKKEPVKNETGVEEKSAEKYEETDWVIRLKDGTEFVGELADIVNDVGLTGYEIERGTVNCALPVGNDTIVSIKIPKGVTALGRSVFKDFKLLETVELPKGMRNIGIESFAHCENLKEVKGIANKISRGAFVGCTDLMSIDLSETGIIEDYAFSKCTALKTAILSSIELLGTASFYKTGITKAVLGVNLRNSGAMTFANCENLVDVEFKNAPNLTTMLDHGTRVFANAESADDVMNINFACMFLNCKNLENVNIDTDLFTKYNNFMFKNSSLYFED